MDNKYSILLITRCFYHHGDATSEVVANFAEALSKDGHRVRIASLTSFPEDMNVKFWNGIEITNQYFAALKSREQIKREISNKPISSLGIHAMHLMNRVYRRLHPDYKKLSLDPILTHAYIKLLKKSLVLPITISV